MRPSFVSRAVLAILIVLATVVLEASNVFSYVSKLHLTQSDRKPRPAYLFLPLRPPEAPLPCVIVAVAVGSQEFLQYHVHCQSLADRGFAVLLIDPSNYPESLSPEAISEASALKCARTSGRFHV